MNTIQIPTTFDDDRLKTSHVLSVVLPGFSRHAKRFGIGAIPRDAEGRKVTEGPLVPGPWAFTYGLALVLDNHGGTRAEAESMRAEGTEHQVEFGDRVVIDGVTYTVTRQGREWIDLVPVDA